MYNISTDNLIKFLTSFGLTAIAFSVSLWYYSTVDENKQGLPNQLERINLDSDVLYLQLSKDELIQTLPYSSYNVSPYHVYEKSKNSSLQDSLSNVILYRYKAKTAFPQIKSTIDSLNNISLHIAKKEMRSIRFSYDSRLINKNDTIVKFFLVLLGIIGLIIFIYGIYYWYIVDRNIFKN